MLLISFCPHNRLHLTRRRDQGIKQECSVSVSMLFMSPDLFFLSFCPTLPWPQLPPLCRLLPNLNLCSQLLFGILGSQCLTASWSTTPGWPQNTWNLRWPDPSFSPTNLPFLLSTPSPVSGHTTQASSFLLPHQLPRPALPPLYFPKLLFLLFLSDFSNDLRITSHLDHFNRLLRNCLDFHPF